MDSLHQTFSFPNLYLQPLAVGPGPGESMTLSLSLLKELHDVLTLQIYLMKAHGIDGNSRDFHNLQKPTRIPFLLFLSYSVEVDRNLHYFYW